MRKPLIAALLLIPACLLLYRPQASTDQAYYEAWAPFWLPEDGMQAMLLLNNNRGEQAPFELEFYGPQGAPLNAVSMSAEANASLSIPLGSYLQGVQSGSIALRCPISVNLRPKSAMQPPFKVDDGPRAGLVPVGQCLETRPAAQTACRHHGA